MLLKKGRKGEEEMQSTFAPRMVLRTDAVGHLLSVHFPLLPADKIPAFFSVATCPANTHAAALCALEPTAMFQTSQSAYPACPVETTVKALVHIFHHSLCPLTDHGASPCPPPWCGLCPFLGPYEYNKLSFQWQLSPDPLTHWPYHT